MRWLVDGYNVIRRDPELLSRERQSLEAGRQALCGLLVEVARASGGRTGGGPGVVVIYSSARESADHVLVRMAREGGAVVSNDREVRQAAARAGAQVVTSDQFLARLDESAAASDAGWEDKDPDDHEDDRRRPPAKGNPRRLSKKDRAARRALDRLGAARPLRRPR